MTAKEYLSQVHRLDSLIGSDLEELARLRALSESISSPVIGSEPNPSRSTEAGFVKSVLKIAELEEKIGAEVAKLVKLKDQVRTTIDTVPTKEEKLVLKYRYILGWTWYQIGSELIADESTVRRWHSSALEHVRLPKKPVQI